MTDQWGWWGGAAVFGSLLLIGGCDQDAKISPLGQTGGTGGSGNSVASTGGGSTPDATAGGTTDESTSGPSAGSGSTGVDPSGPGSEDTGVSEPGSEGSTGSGVTADSSESTGPAPECLLDTDCEPGRICEDRSCVPGCSGRQPCGDGLSCCDAECIDTTVSLLHCGVCDNECEIPKSVDVFCDGVSCQLGECDDGMFDCDGVAGCESEIECTCDPEDSQPCYPGPANTEGVGICAAGTQQCNPFGTGWGACVGFQVPEAADVCGNLLDDDCDGTPDNIPDVDGDGWTLCENDCCEDEFECGDPALVNPGAFEFVGNGVDDDCDPTTSDVAAAPACSNAAIFGNVDADDMAEAIDLCQFTNLVEPLETRKWGVVSAEFLTAAGGTPPAGHLADIMDRSTAVLQNYGTGGVGPLVNDTMAGMSSGWMRDADDPDYVVPNGGADFGHEHLPPAGYLAANGGTLPALASCNGACPSGAGANDSVNLRLTLRVPTNAQSFSYRFRFFSSEYWTYACTEYNDFYLALLDSDAAGLPADGNISFDALSNPVSVNNGFFESCVANGCYTCPSGAGALAGTGMELGNTGGGTEWLVTTAPVVPGEIITLDLMIFDVSDNVLDSLVLLDGFEWDIDPSDVATNPQG